MMRKNKVIYCWNCGTKNDLSNKTCLKCSTDLNEHDFKVAKWLFGEGYDEITGNFIQKLFTLARDFLHLHLFGTTLSIAVIFTFSATVSHYEDTTHNNKEIVQQEYRLTKNENHSVSKEKYCDDGYTLEDGKCIKKEIIAATTESICENGYYLNGNKCYSDKVYAKNVKYRCIQTIDEYRKLVGKVTTHPADPYTDADFDCLITFTHEDDHTCSYNFGAYKEMQGEQVCEALYGFGTDALKEETCPSGSVNIDGKCRTSVNPKVNYKCADDYVLQDDNNCLKIIETKPKEK